MFKISAFSLMLFSSILILPIPVAGLDGKPPVEKSVALLSSQEQWQMAQSYFANNQLQQALQLAKLAIGNLEFVDRPKALFLIGECQYRNGEWDVSAAQFSKVVELERGGDLLEPSLSYLWQIAEKYRCKTRHHLFGYKNLPRWSADQSPCLPLYNLISEALPFSDLAERALLAKGKYLRQIGDFGHSNEALHALIFGFSKGQRACESCELIGLNLLDLMQLSPGNEELLSSALNNLERSKSIFEGDEKWLEVAKCNVEKMRSLLAEHLLKTGQFYERIKKPYAARLYYQRVLDQFSQTSHMSLAKRQLTALQTPS